MDAKIKREINIIRKKMGNLSLDKAVKKLTGKECKVNEKEVDETLKLLKDPNILEKINKEFDKTIAGEEDTRKAVFIGSMAALIENLQSPMNILVNAESSSGKSWICKQVCKILPPNIWNKKECYRTKITPEAFTYWHNAKFEPEWSWDGKVCYLEDVGYKIVSSDTFKVMASEGSSSTVVIKQRAIDININGIPIMLVTTASTSPSFEVLNRFYLLSLDETDDQTEKIMQFQAKVAERGFKEVYDPNLQDALACLKRIKVRIPFAWVLINHFSKQYVRMRRDFPRFFDLIKCSVALHQYQRETDKEGYYLPKEQDYMIARDVLIKIRGSSAIASAAGITHKLKKCFQACLELSEEQGMFTVKEIHAHYPIISEKSWYTNLDKLLELKLLNILLVKKEGYKGEVKTYQTKTVESCVLPTFEELTIVTNEAFEVNPALNNTNPPKTTNVTNTTITTNVTNATNDNNKEGKMEQCTFPVKEEKLIVTKEKIQT